jgi:catechol 2,3-dioxygenase-like lactoylglutathione lyase family enzyme
VPAVRVRPRPRAPDGAVPPPVDLGDEGGGGGSGWVRLLRARNDIDGHLLVGRLGEAGVEACMVWEKGAPSAWLYGASKPWSPVAVMVRRRQLDDARLVLAEVSWEGPDHVREVAVETPDWRVPVVWWATAIVLGTLLTGTALAELANATFVRCRVPILCSND